MRVCQRFEAGLQKIADGLTKPRGEKNANKLWLRIGRLKEKSHGVSQHYTITLQAQEGAKSDQPDLPDKADATDQHALTLRWEKKYLEGGECQASCRL